MSDSKKPNHELLINNLYQCLQYAYLLKIENSITELGYIELNDILSYCIEGAKKCAATNANIS